MEIYKIQPIHQQAGRMATSVLQRKRNAGQDVKQIQLHVQLGQRATVFNKTSKTTLSIEGIF